MEIRGGVEPSLGRPSFDKARCVVPTDDCGLCEASRSADARHRRAAACAAPKLVGPSLGSLDVAVLQLLMEISRLNRRPLVCFIV